MSAVKFNCQFDKQLGIRVWCCRNDIKCEAVYLVQLFVGTFRGHPELGREDLTNTRKCHMKSDTVDVVACNDNYGTAEMKIRVNKEFYDAKSGTNQTPIGLEVEGDDYVQVRVLPRSSIFFVIAFPLFAFLHPFYSRQAR